MKTEPVKISIITACFNSAKTLQNTIDSILNQSVKPFEYLIIDGASTDETVSIIKANEPRFEKENIRFQWLSEKDQGIYDAWNKGVNLVQGDWIAFLGSDDEYMPNSLVKYVKKIIQNPTSDFVTAKAKLTSGGKVIREFGEVLDWGVFKREMKILHAGGFLNSNYIKKFGLFDTSFKITGDYELLLRKGDTLSVAFIDEVLVEMGADGVSSTHIESAFKDARRAKVKNKVRGVILAYFDYYWVLLKIKIKTTLTNG